MSDGPFSHERMSESAVSEDISPFRPAPPIAKRLNRNALTVAAVVMGMTVLTAIVLINPRHSEVNGAGGGATPGDAPVPTQPSFLDQPARTPSTPSSPTVRGDTALAAVTPPAVSPAAPGGIEQPTSDPYASSPAPLTVAAAPPQASPREQAYQAALTSAVVLGVERGNRSPEAALDNTPSRPSLAADEDQLLKLEDSVLHAAMPKDVDGTRASVASTPSRSQAPGGYEEVVQGTSFGSAGRPNNGSGLVRLEPAGSPYTLRAGTIVPGLLITGINSELPGEIMGQVSRDVYDSRLQRVLLIPKGSRLIGTYDNQVVAGKGRMLVAWTRLILPDGRSLQLPGLPLKDPQGQTGIAGSVDNHWRRVFGNALLLSAISAGVQLSQPRQASVLAAPSAGQVASGALGQELSNVALEILRRGMDVAPTITIPAGQPFSVFLNGDLVFDGPYREASTSFAQ